MSHAPAERDATPVFETPETPFERRAGAPPRAGPFFAEMWSARTTTRAPPLT